MVLAGVCKMLPIPRVLVCWDFRFAVLFRVVLIQDSPAVFRRAARKPVVTFLSALESCSETPRDGPLRIECRCTRHHSMTTGNIYCSFPRGSRVCASAGGFIF